MKNGDPLYDVIGQARNLNKALNNLENAKLALKKAEFDYQKNLADLGQEVQDAVNLGHGKMLSERFDSPQWTAVFEKAGLAYLKRRGDIFLREDAA